MKTKKDIYIFGSGGLAKEVYVLNKQLGKYTFKGFIEKENNSDLKIGKNSFKVFCEEDILKINKENSVFAIAIGDPKIIAELAEKYQNSLNFPNIMHPTVLMDKDSIQFELGNIFTAGIILTANIILGKFNYINLNCTIGHDARIGNCNIINPNCNISGGVNIGDFNLLGTSSSIRQYINLGNNNVLGMGSTLVKDIKNNEVWVGNPAKYIKGNV